MNPLIRFLKKYGHLDSEIELELNSKIKCITKQKGDFFLKQGQAVSNLGVIEKGLVRAYYIKNEIEVNSWFAFENEIIGSVMPMFFSQPSFEYIQFLEPSTVYYISINDLNELYNKNPELNLFGKKLAEYLCMLLEIRINSLQTESAEQRYKSLIENYPQTLQRVSLGHIASYLGVKQETLSRIRRKIRF